MLGASLIRFTDLVLSIRVIKEAGVSGPLLGICREFCLNITSRGGVRSRVQPYSILLVSSVQSNQAFRLPEVGELIPGVM